MVPCCTKPKAWKPKFETNKTSISFTTPAGTKSKFENQALSGCAAINFLSLDSACSWDEWVPESRVLKYNDAALQKQKELLKAHEASGG